MGFPTAQERRPGSHKAHAQAHTVHTHAYPTPLHAHVHTHAHTHTTHPHSPSCPCGLGDTVPHYQEKARPGPELAVETHAPQLCDGP